MDCEFVETDYLPCCYSSLNVPAELSVKGFTK